MESDKLIALHRLLKRQMRNAFDEYDPSQIENGLAKLLELVSDAYAQTDLDRALLERSLDLTSRELTTRNRELRTQLEEQEAIKAELEESYSLLQASLNATHDGLLVLDLDNNVRLFNRVFASLLGLGEQSSRIETIDDIRLLLAGRLLNIDAFMEALTNSQGYPEQRAELELAFCDKRFVEAYAKPQLLADEVVGQVWSFRDVTELRLKEEEAKHRAYHDLLTGLPNRRLLGIRLAKALTASQQTNSHTVVLFFDLDGFKDVNDYLGHATGDALLKEVSRRLELQLPPSTILARHGGDEFVAVMECQDDLQNADDFARRVLDAFARPFLLAEDELYMSCSIGIAMSPEHGLDADKLISNADIAMYRAKESGKNTVQYYSAETDSHTVHRLKIRSQITVALEKKQFELFFQPKVSLCDGRIMGAEALIRWRSPDGSYRSPIEFIPTAEENGQIIPISQWLIRQCCQHLVDWQPILPENFVLAMNISAKHFKRGVLQEDLKQALRETGAAPSTLELEVTETAVMDNIDLAVSTLKELSAIGIRTAIDDFGTGHSSLNYLRRLPIEILKIDKSFIDEILSSDEDRTLVAGIINMVHALGMGVVAEGVENKPMADLLKTMGCDLVQGYHYCPPIPESEFIELLKTQKCYEV